MKAHIFHLCRLYQILLLPSFCKSSKHDLSLQVSKWQESTGPLPLALN